MFQQQVEADLRQEALMRWVNRRIGETYVRIDAPHKGCTMEMPWLSGSINARAIETGGRKDRSDPPDDGR
jgi:hypothetical protein